MLIKNAITPNKIHNKLIDAFNESACTTHLEKRLQIKLKAIDKIDWMPIKGTVCEKLPPRNKHYATL